MSELPVAVLLGLAAFSVTWPATHLAALGLWMVAVGWHVRARVLPSLRRWAARSRPRRLRLVSSTLVVMLAAAVLVTSRSSTDGVPRDHGHAARTHVGRFS